MNRPDALPKLVLIHDLMGTPLEFDLLRQILGARDVGFEFLEIPGYTHGHGRPVMDWRAWVAATQAAIDACHGPEARYVVGGLGTGAALAAAVALEPHGRQVRGVAFLSPTFVVDGPCAPAARRFASTLRVDRWMSIVRSDPFGIKNPKTRKWIARDLEDRGVSAIGAARFPLRALRESERLHAHVRPSLGSLPAPSLVLHATEDGVSSIAQAKRLVDELGQTARLVALEHSYRMITMDNDRQRVAHELADFIGAPKRRAEPPHEPVRRARTPATSVAAG